MKRLILKTIIIILTICILLLSMAYILFRISKSRSFQFFGGLTNRVSTEEKVVALTFDDAPTPHTVEILNVLQEKDVKATFYAIGKNIEQHPDIAAQIVDVGMEIGNHSYSHERFLLKSQPFIKNEVETTNALIRSVGYTGEITFRPPNGKKLFGLPWYLHQHHIQTITWDVEPDTYYSTADEMVKYTLEQTKPGSIILMHPFCDTCTADREALPVIIEKLQTQGYKFLTINELLRLK